MALGYIARAMQRGLDLHGEASTLQGTACGKVQIERSVRLDAGLPDRAEDNHVAYADVATISKQYAPRTGQTLVHPDGTFRLNRLLEDNGFNMRFVVVGLPA